MKNTFRIKLNKDSWPLTFSSMFDSGNMEKVEFGLNNTIIITPANDCAGTSLESHAKGWFYFSVNGACLHTSIKLLIRKISPLGSQVISEIYRANNHNTLSRYIVMKNNNGPDVYPQKQS